MDGSYWILTLTPLLSLFSYAVLLVLVLRRAARSRLQRTFALYLVVMATWSLGSAMMRLDPEHIVLWNKVLTGSGMITPLAFFWFAVTFLNRKQSLWLRVGIVMLVGLQVANALDLIVIGPSLQEAGLLDFQLGPAAYGAAVYGLLFYALSFGFLVAAYRRTPQPVVRNRIRYVLLGVIVLVLGGSTNYLSSLSAFPVDHATNLINALLLTYAVLRYQLVDITLVLRRGLFYSIPTAIIGIVYFLVISMAANIFHAFAGPQLLILSLVVAAITALVAQPLRDRAQLWVDRLFFREKYDASRMLQQLSRTAASVLDLDKLTSMILDGITNTMHIERAAFFIRQAEGGEFRMIAHRGLAPDTDMRLRSDHPLVDWLSRREDALSRYEMDLIPHFKALWGHELQALHKLGAELYVPLKAKGDLVGILTVGRKLSEESYSQDDKLTLITLANHTATALENARLHDETRRRYSELALLNRLIAASTSSRQIESLLRTVCQELPAAFGELRAAAVLLNEERTEATIVSDGDSTASGPGDQPAGLVALLVGGGSRSPEQSVSLANHNVLQCLLGHTVPLIMDDAWSDPRLAPILDGVRDHNISSLLSLPLLVEGEVTGLICLAAIKPYPFTAEEIDLARRVAEQISGALARARLTEAQQRLNTAVEQAAEAVMITDTDGAVLYVNPAFEQMSGYRREELNGRRPLFLPGDENGDAFAHYLGRVMVTDHAWQGRLADKKRDGTEYIVDMTVTPVRNQDGEIVNYVVTMRDVTRELQLERQFHLSQKMEALGRLAGGIAHDFNNLLTVIQLSTRFMRRKMAPDDPMRDHLQRIEETGERAGNLTKQLLSFSRRGIIEPQIVNLNHLVSELSRMLQRIIGEDVELVIRLAPDLWSVKVDPSQMEQVILNLAVNARDAMPHGGTLSIETANVTLDKEPGSGEVDMQPGKHVMVMVRDTGVGMDDEVKSHLFEPFFTTKERGQGTGLGLSTVFGIVRQSDGHIEVQSEVGQGTTFKIYLPRTEETRLETVSRVLPPRSTEGTETILVVEDEPEVRELTVDTLRTQGYRVLAASNGLEALQVGREYDGPIQLLLTDVVMPRMDGRELVEQMLPERPEMRVLYMSGYTDRLVVKQAVLDPGFAFLPKPFNVETLAYKVRSVLEDGT